MNVTVPADQTSVSGSAITALHLSATDTQPGASLTWSATGVPAGLALNASTGTITGTPTSAGTYQVTATATATDGNGYAGLASFTWTVTSPVTNTVSVTTPANQTDVSGSAITALAVHATDSSPTATLSYAAAGLPAGLVHRLSHRDHHGHAHHRRDLPGHPRRHGQLGLLGLGQLHLGHHRGRER